MICPRSKGSKCQEWYLNTYPLIAKLAFIPLMERHDGLLFVRNKWKNSLVGQQDPVGHGVMDDELGEVG